jgi:hypothetical protein
MYSDGYRGDGVDESTKAAAAERLKSVVGIAHHAGRNARPHPIMANKRC